MKPAWKRGLVGLAAIGAILVSARVASYVQAGRTLRAYVETHGADVAAQRAKLHAIRLPARDKPPSALRCADAQGTLLRDSVYRKSPPGYAASVDAWPTKRVPEDARDWVRARAEPLDRLRASLGCSQTLEDSESSRASLRLMWATRGVILDGLQHAEDGDVAGAVERELDAIRLGEQNGTSTAWATISDALLALARVIASTPSNASLEQAGEGLDALAPFVPAATAMAEEMKRLLLDAARDTDPDPIGKLDAPRYDPIRGWQRVKMRLDVLLLPRRALLASAVTELDAQLDRAIEALRSGSAERASAVEEALVAENAKTANPIVWLTAVPFTIEHGRKAVRAACALAVARATLAIERTRDASGHYGAPAMPDDPCAHGSPLHWEALAAGYRVWSVGANGRDESGRHEVSFDEERADDLEASRR